MQKHYEHLEFWKYDIIKEKRGADAGRYCLVELMINKGRFGGNVLSTKIFTSKTFDGVVEYCKKNKIKVEDVTV